jgi:hypothetical protein
LPFYIVFKLFGFKCTYLLFILQIIAGRQPRNNPEATKPKIEVFKGFVENGFLGCRTTFFFGVGQFFMSFFQKIARGPAKKK